ncbi:MAG: ABC transporter ATP-binding protein [Vicinamibacterales bacterium]
MAAITLHGVEKIFENGHAAVRDLSFTIGDGELLVLVGPSGCGKSTALRLIAGLDTPTRGRIEINGRDVTAVPPQQRDLAMVFQNYALYPHKTVRENLAFGLRARGVDAALAAERVASTAAALGIQALLDRKPAQLSGGQRQRVALGRAIVREPQAFLLDEPLSNLDPLLRVGTRAELILLQRRLAATMIYVTHDQEEAMTLGTRIAVMRDGRVEQIAPPLEVFERPATTFVAQFVGSPSMNLWPCTVERRDGAVRLVMAAWSIDLAGSHPGGATGDLTVGIRPHEIALVEPDSGDAVGRIEIVEPLGAMTTVHVAVDGVDELTRVVTAPDGAIKAGDRIGLRLRRDRLHLFTAAGARLETAAP